MMRTCSVLVTVFLVLTKIAMAQVDPNTFPKMGYADIYWTNYNNYWDQHIYNNHAPRKFYYPELNAMGLNYVVTNGRVLLNHDNSWLGNIKVLDDDLKKQTAEELNLARSTGNDENFFQYEVGGTNIAGIDNVDQNFGFGNIETTSWWAQNRANTTGLMDKEDGAYPNSYKTFCALRDEHAPGYLLRGEFPPFHQPTVRRLNALKLGIRCRINTITGGNPLDTVAIVYLRTSVGTRSLVPVPKMLLQEEGDATNALSDQVFVITANNFTNNQYSNINIEFRKNFIQGAYAWNRLILDVYWTKKRDFYIDKFWIYDAEYESLFVADSVTRVARRETLKSLINLNFGSRATKPQWAHLYNDEAYPHSARSVKALSELSQEALGSDKYVTGVNNWYYYDQERYSNKVFRPPYIEYDSYVLRGETDSVSENPTVGKHGLQQAFDDLVSFNWDFNPIEGQLKNGLRNSIVLAQNETPDDETDDVPFYFCMQTCSQLEVAEGTVSRVANREPTYNEILAQGWLGLCYGAKGMMYYTIMTLAGEEFGTFWGVYGVFESEGQQGTLFQNPSLTQIPNYRYYAVKELNRQIDQVSSQLLKLHWVNAFSLHKDNLQCDYLASVRSFYKDGHLAPQWEEDPQGKNFIEVGLFKDKAATNPHRRDLFMVVNRRCLSSEGRKMIIKINKESSVFANWKITDVATDSVYIVARDGELSVWLPPGTGKLFKLEPVLASGGTLVFNEEIAANSEISISGQVTVPVGKSITIHKNTNIQFLEGSGLLIDGQVNILGENSQPVVLNFVSQNSTARLQVSNGGSVNMKHTSFLNARTAIYCSESPAMLRIDSCNFENNFDAIALYNFGTNIYISNSTFINNNRAILAGLGTTLILSNNMLTGNYVPIQLIMVPNFRIMHTRINGNGNLGANGIYLQSSNGFIEHTEVTGYKIGLHCYGSSPMIGYSKFSHNSYYGIYSAGGSIPNMDFSLLPFEINGAQGSGGASSGSPMFVSLGGYNAIIENGSTTRDFPHDPLDDGSEVKLNQGSMVLGGEDGGRNSIYDDRQGDNTELLISSRQFHHAILDGRNIFWGNGGFSSSRMQNIYRILSDPWQSSSPVLPQNGTLPVVIADSVFGPIDTLLAFNESGRTVSERDYSYAEGIFRLYSGNQNAGDCFNIALAASVDSVQRFDILSKMYMLDCLGNENPTEFERLRSMYLSFANTISDTILMKAMSNLSVLCLLRSEQYEEAVQAFLDIISSNPNSEEAAYAQIDLLMAKYLASQQNAVLPKNSFDIPMANISEKLTELINSVSKFSDPNKRGTETIPLQYVLQQNYPNPFNPSTKISFELPLKDNVRIDVFNHLGQLITTLVQTELSAGVHSVMFDGQGQSSGVYYYRLTTSRYSESKKMLLLK